MLGGCQHSDMVCIVRLSFLIKKILLVLLMTTETEGSPVRNKLQSGQFTNGLQPLSSSLFFLDVSFLQQLSEQHFSSIVLDDAIKGCTVSKTMIHKNR
jgi:hypothetical protein